MDKKPCHVMVLELRVIKLLTKKKKAKTNEKKVFNYNFKIRVLII